MRYKKIFSAVASIIKLFIILMFFLVNSKAEKNNIKYYSEESGTVALMYHRFDEKKYPSTNIQMDIFKKQMKSIKENKYDFYNPGNFAEDFNLPKNKKKILITIDDAFSSFYNHAWPYLKENKIPFILFVSTEPVGKNGYMSWKQIKEIEKEKFAFIGNHSHSHDYLLDLTFEKFKNDINKSIKIFKKELGYNPMFFSYPFGEYSLEQTNFIKEKFQYGFGQHSGVIDLNKNVYELPRFPINEKYGDIKRFEFIINLNPLQYKKIYPINKYIDSNNNPPNFYVNFFDDQRNLENINCFSDEGNKWERSKTIINNKTLKIIFRDKFLFRRGRINCSLNDDGVWRWFGVQFSVKIN